MKSAVETLSPTRAKLTVEVPFEELSESLDAAYKKIAQQINIPGFRKGKAPRSLIDQRVGRETVVDDAVNEALPKLYFDALREHELEPLAQPEIEMTRRDDEGFEFTVEVDVRPTITLPDYAGLEVSIDDAVVTDEDVEEQLQHLRERFATLLDVEREAADRDFVVIDLKATQDGEVVEGAEVAGFSYQVGRGGMLDGLDEALAGMSAGDTKTFGSKLVGGDEAGQDVEVEVVLTKVQEQQLPELDDEFAQLASEFDTVGELTDDVRVRLQNGKRLEQAAAARDAVLEKLLDLVEVPLPEGPVTDELNARRQNAEEQVAYAGMTLAEYLDSQEQTVDEFEAELEKSVRDSMAAHFVLDEVARQEEFAVDQQELVDHMVRRAQQAGESPNDYIKHMMEHNHVPEIVAEVVRGKALASIVEQAKVTDASGNVVELANLRGDGTIGEPDAVEAEVVADAVADAGPDATPDTAPDTEES